MHIHFKIRTDVDDTGYEFTSQLFIYDSLTDTVYLQNPYNTRGTHDMRNEDDSIYPQGDSQLMLY